MGNFFAELQAMSVMQDDSITDVRKKCNEIVKFFKSRDVYKQELTWFADLVRGLKPETLIEADSFMCQDDFVITSLPEELRHDSLGFCVNNYVVFAGRYVYPVKDVKGDVMGWCGYDKFDGAKYLDSQTYGYKAKQGVLYGMEHMREYYEGNEPIFFVEGIGCTLFLRQEGLCSLAALGSYLTPYVIEIIKRFGHRAIIITDSDESGNKFRKQARRVAPNARVIQSAIAKDIDDSRKVEPAIVDELRKLKNPFYISKMFR